MTDAKDVRDVEADYLKAYIEEYETNKRCGHEDRAHAVAAVLRQMGHEVESRKRPAPTKETAVSPEPLERAVEEDAAPKRRGRPSRKAE